MVSAPYTQFQIPFKFKYYDNARLLNFTCLDEESLEDYELSFLKYYFEEFSFPNLSVFAKIGSHVNVHLHIKKLFSNTKTQKEFIDALNQELKRIIQTKLPEAIEVDTAHLGGIHTDKELRT